jgi:hypothetical protein
VGGALWRIAAQQGAAAGGWRARRLLLLPQAPPPQPLAAPLPNPGAAPCVPRQCLRHPARRAPPRAARRAPPPLPLTRNHTATSTWCSAKIATAAMVGRKRTSSQRSPVRKAPGTLLGHGLPAAASAMRAGSVCSACTTAAAIARATRGVLSARPGCCALRECVRAQSAGGGDVRGLTRAGGRCKLAHRRGFFAVTRGLGGSDGADGRWVIACKPRAGLMGAPRRRGGGAGATAARATPPRRPRASGRPTDRRGGRRPRAPRRPQARTWRGSRPHPPWEASSLPDH